MRSVLNTDYVLYPSVDQHYNTMRGISILYPFLFCNLVKQYPCNKSNFKSYAWLEVKHVIKLPDCFQVLHSHTDNIRHWHISVCSFKILCTASIILGTSSGMDIKFNLLQEWIADRYALCGVMVLRYWRTKDRIGVPNWEYVLPLWWVVCTTMQCLFTGSRSSYNVTSARSSSII